MIRPLVLALCLVGTAAFAQDIRLPAGAVLLSERGSALDTYQLPVGVFKDGAVPERLFTGRIMRRTWRVDGSSLTSLQILEPIRSDLEATGYEVVFECEDRSCGGFDFRFEIEVVPAPDMHVDISDYRVLSAVHGDSDAVSVLISGGRAASFVQVIAVQPTDMPEVAPSIAVVEAPVAGAPTDALPVPEQQDLAAQLLTDGYVILEDLEFAKGHFELADKPFASLAALAALLASQPDLRIAFVGHTDNTGDLNTNLDLSQQRADAVLFRLVSDYSVDPDRLEALGVGYLAPRFPNISPAGREANRRVEAVIPANP